MSGRRPAGMTLSEVLVACSVASVVTVLIASLLVLATRSYRAQQDRASLQLELLLAREDLTSFLTGAARPTLSLAPRLMTATFVEEGTPHYAGGHPEWRAFIQYELEGSELVRKVKPFTPATECPAIPASLPDSSSIRRVVVARNVSSVAFTLTGDLLAYEVEVSSGSTTLQGRFSILIQQALL